MINKLLALLFTLVSSINVLAQDKYALIIGIGNYKEETGWTQIHGNNDMPIIRQWLLSNQFKENNISILRDSEATHDAIIKEFNCLIDNIDKNDIVYIHFSGHGQQITDLNGDENDGYDEAWIPFDAYKEYKENVYMGEKHIVDDNLNELLTKIRTKIGDNGKIVVVSDACHSGSGTRSEDVDEEIYVRGVNDKFLIPSRFACNNESYAENDVDWLFIGACKSYQSNFEYKHIDTYYGSLSYIISHNEIDVLSNNHHDVIEEWQRKLTDISFYPQNIDKEGTPNKKSKTLF